MSESTRYQFVRDREAWDAILVALERDGDGNLTLAQLPGPADGQAVYLPGPWAADPSGIAAAPCAAVFVADTDHNRVLFVDGSCAARAWLPATTTGRLGAGPVRPSARARGSGGWSMGRRHRQPANPALRFPGARTRSRGRRRAPPADRCRD